MTSICYDFKRFCLNIGICCDASGIKKRSLEADADTVNPPKKRGRKPNHYVANKWSISSKCTANTDYFNYIGKYCIDEEVDKSFT
jgi:hypothetical protein